MDLKLRFFNNYLNRNVVKLGVIYIPSIDPANPNTSNYNTNDFFLKIVDTITFQLSINEIELIKVPLQLPNSLSATNEDTKKIIYNTLSSYKDVTYFISSLNSQQLEILHEVYFRYNKRITLLSTGSSQVSIKFNDNIIRFLSADYGLVNFISNYYLYNTNNYYDCIFISGFFPELSGQPVFGTIRLIEETVNFINDYLNLTNRKLILNPLITNNENSMNIDKIINQNTNILDSIKNPNYYKTNYYSNYIIQYIQNSPSSNATEEYKKIFNQWVKDYPSVEVTNWKVFESYLLPNMFVDSTKWSIIYHFMLYITLFDYTQNKQILLFMSNFQFSAFFSIIVHLCTDFEKIFNKKNIKINFISNVKVIFTNTQNRDEFTSSYFNDTRTDTLWYNNGNTFNSLLDLFEPRIFIPRFDQSINVLINKLSIELDMYSKDNKYIDLSKSSQILIIPIYNAIQFLFHFFKNGITINSFIFDYFSKSKLLRFGNNIIFDANMDNVYDIYVGTTYFNNNMVLTKNITRNIVELNIYLSFNDDNTINNTVKTNNRLYTEIIKLINATSTSTFSINDLSPSNIKIWDNIDFLKFYNKNIFSDKYNYAKWDNLWKTINKNTNNFNKLMGGLLYPNNEYIDIKNNIKYILNIYNIDQSIEQSIINNINTPVLIDNDDYSQYRNTNTGNIIFNTFDFYFLKQKNNPFQNTFISRTP
jgi:hypothetical protein